jgi:hypothetical protein
MKRFVDTFRYSKPLMALVILTAAFDLLFWLLLQYIYISRIPGFNYGGTDEWTMFRPLLFVVLWGLAFVGLIRKRFPRESLTGACWLIAILIYLSGWRDLFAIYRNYFELVPPIRFTVVTSSWNEVEVIRGILLLIIISWWLIELARNYAKNRSTGIA